MKYLYCIIIYVFGFSFISCVSQKFPIINTNTSQMFNASRSTVFNAAITLLQSNAYSIEFADIEKGVIAATKKTSPSFGAGLAESIVSGAIAGLVGSDEATTTSFKVSKVFFNFENLDGLTTEVKLKIKKGTSTSTDNLKNEALDKSKYSEKMISKNKTYQKWFKGLAIEVMKRETLEKNNRTR